MDYIFRLLVDKHRRRLLVALLDHNPQSAGPPGVTEAVYGGDREDRRLYITMQHKHLPMLEDAGAISWDRDTYEIHAGPRFDELRPLLELLHDNADALPGEWV